MTAALALPAYFNPTREAGSWDLVRGYASAVRFVVLNPASGPGPAPEQEYASLRASLRLDKIKVLGYVNTDYGSRSRADVLQDTTAYRSWYDVDGVFFDQVASDVAGLDFYEQVVTDARGAGCRSVALNPGVYPHRAYLDLANLVVTFEGSLEEHRALQVPAWARDVPASRFCHLVYGVPESDLAATRARAELAHAGAVYVTDLHGTNPWGELPSYFPALAGMP